MSPERSQAEDDALLRLQLAVGAVASRRKLLDTCGSAVDALAAGEREWRSHGIDTAQVQALLHPDRGALARSRAWLQQPGHHLLGWHDPDYPALLRRIASPPLALFIAGDPALLWHPAVAVVGSRSPSAGGLDHGFDFARAFAASGLAVTSGLAAGIDTAAHTGALSADGKTIAVLGTGPDVPYPRANTHLHARIAARGAVVSEHAPGTGVRREQFPSRNRIIAGLSLGTVVVEAAQRSGALITARQAADAGREVFALPGSIANPLARGCHRLIRDGAMLVESAQEVIEALGPLAAQLAEDLRGRLGAPNSGAATAVGSAASDAIAAEPDYHRLWQALGHDPTGMDGLVSRTGLTAARLSSMLLVMELEGRVVSRHGRYTRRSSTVKPS
ncbi:MAG: DNA-processing protein DprA [Luteimonas sp.]